MKFEEILLGHILMHKRSKAKCQVIEHINENVVKVLNLKYGVVDYVNRNTFNQYERVDEI